MRTGLDWYARNPKKFLGGVQGLTSRQIAVYNVVIDLIYLYGGGCNNDPKWIAGYVSDMGSAAVRGTIQDLVMLGKLYLDGSQLRNREADRIVGTRKKRGENPGKTEEKRGENAEKTEENRPEKSLYLDAQSRETNGLHDLRARVLQKNREEKSSEDKSSDAGGVETDFAKRVFEEGVALLIRSGLAEKQARSTIGRWRKEQSDPALIEAFTAFAGSGAVDPVGWISARFAKPKAPAPASFEQQVVFFAEWLRSDRYVPSSAISATMARELVARKLVEPETLRAKGISA
jgi:hypothetical protein